MKIFSFICLIAISGSSLFGQEVASKSNLKILPVLFQQQAAEYRALCYQAFNIASLRIEKVRKKRKSLPLAIITDVDETVLDNSKSEAQWILEGKSYSDALWKEWTDKSVATLVPGALEFLHLAKKKGIEIFYVSNRDTTEVNSTVLNLKNLNAPNADAQHMIFKIDKSTKEPRRQMVMQKYNVIMLIGDNLNDFTTLFESKNSVERKLEVDKVREEWGRKFIVLPNVMYGEWESALFDYKGNLTNEEKNEILRKKLEGF
jgi:5'-nucleotidase (lipoprotein e(P4) family)